MAFLVLLVSRPWPDFKVVVVPLGVSALLAGFRQVLVTYWTTFTFSPVLFLPFSTPLTLDFFFIKKVCLNLRLNTDIHHITFQPPVFFQAKLVLTWCDRLSLPVSVTTQWDCEWPCLALSRTVPA